MHISFQKLLLSCTDKINFTSDLQVIQKHVCKLIYLKQKLWNTEDLAVPIGK